MLAERDEGFCIELQRAVGNTARVWRSSQVDEKVRPPYVTYEAEEDASLDHMSGTTGLGRVSYRVICFAPTEEGARELQQAIWDALHGQAKVGGNAWWRVSRVANRLPGVSLDGGGNRISVARELTVSLVYSRT